MERQHTTQTTYTIKEAAKISGLPESTLRYYETIGLIGPIPRDASSKYRVYSEDEVNLVVVIACLNATGLSIEDMRRYLANREKGASGAHDQINLLSTHEKHLSEMIHDMQLRYQYVKSKINYWKAVETGDKQLIKVASNTTYEIAHEMKLPKSIRPATNHSS